MVWCWLGRGTASQAPTQVSGRPRVGWGGLKWNRQGSGNCTRRFLLQPCSQPGTCRGWTGAGRVCVGCARPGPGLQKHLLPPPFISLAGGFSLFFVGVKYTGSWHLDCLQAPTRAALHEHMHPRDCPRGEGSERAEGDAPDLRSRHRFPPTKVPPPVTGTLPGQSRTSWSELLLPTLPVSG